ncbi:hypothetical protein HY024_01165 [Candidatus Curtissbacteria bacterium]|nr:hypothetical protein [Candidatus Curtissbacteria bacterium]
MSERFVAIGHITNDLPNKQVPKEHLGGGVSYAAVTAARLGMEAHIITRCPTDHPYIAELNKLGVDVHVLPYHRDIPNIWLLPSGPDSITSFENTYDSKGNRTQRVTQIQQDITPLDINLNVSPALFDGAVVLVAPVIDEVHMDVARGYPGAKSVSITPQGCFRRVDLDGRVYQKKWRDYMNLPQATIVLSDEDVNIDGRVHKSLLREIVDESKMVAFTQGANGVALLAQEEEPVNVGAFDLEEGEAGDPTGAGDVFATVFISEASRTDGDLKAAAVSACYFAAIKIIGAGGFGISSIPDLAQFKGFATTNSKRTAAYLQKENIKQLSLLR